MLHISYTSGTDGAAGPPSWRYTIPVRAELLELFDGEMEG